MLIIQEAQKSAQRDRSVLQRIFRFAREVRIYLFLQMTKLPNIFFFFNVKGKYKAQFIFFYSLFVFLLFSICFDASCTLPSSSFVLILVVGKRKRNQRKCRGKE